LIAYIYHSNDLKNYFLKLALQNLLLKTTSKYIMSKLYQPALREIQGEAVETIEFLGWLSHLRQNDFPSQGCLKASDLRQLALRQREPNPSERDHLRQCRRCLSLRDGIFASFQHLPVMTIARVIRGEANDPEREFAEVHLRPDGDNCQWCQWRYNASPFSLLIMLQGDVPSRMTEDELKATANTGLELECFKLEDPEVVRLELRTKEKSLCDELTLFSVVGQGNQIITTQARVIRPDCDGWFTAQIGVNLSRHDRCTGALAGVVSRPALLSPSDWELVGQAIRGSSHHDEQIAWALWQNKQMKIMTAE
jgi:hypothetical protein